MFDKWQHFWLFIFINQRIINLQYNFFKKKIWFFKNGMKWHILPLWLEITLKLVEGLINKRYFICKNTTYVKILIWSIIITNTNFADIFNLYSLSWWKIFNFEVLIVQATFSTNGKSRVEDGMKNEYLLGSSKLLKTQSSTKIQDDRNNIVPKFYYRRFL